MSELSGTSPRPATSAARLLPLLIAAASPAYAEPAREMSFSPEQRAYWALQPVERHDPPVLSGPARVRNPVDSFVLAKLSDEGLAPSPQADKAALVRRVFLDVTGLPPSPEDVSAFVADDSPEAYERLVDRLLASPHYGERWGRHWLDLARYAESGGFEQDITRPNAWRYRDYVSDAFNADKPYDKFVQEQIAGDELWPERPDARIATAFNRNYAEEPNQKDLLLARQETLHDITSVVGSTFLGLTFGCAQCHDHKFDPISQRDYYRLQAFFANVNHVNSFPMVLAAEYKEYERKLAIWEDRTAAIWKEMYDLLEPLRKFTPEQLLHRYPDYVIEAVETPADRRDPQQEWMASLLSTKVCGTCPIEPKPYLDPGFRGRARRVKGEAKRRFEELEAELAKFAHLKPADVPRGTGIYDVGPNPPATYVLGNGLYTSPGEEVQPGFLSILDPAPATIVPPPDGQSTGRRSALAMWLTDPANPLVARVMVNRVWHHHFGRGIVATPSDFGAMGGRPTHPKLLDWLASEFVDSGWSVKHIHRIILRSSTYRQAAKPDPARGIRGLSGSGRTGRSLQQPAVEVSGAAPGGRGRAGRGPVGGGPAESNHRRSECLPAAAGGSAQPPRRLERDRVGCRSSQAQRLRVREEKHAPALPRKLRFPGHARVLRQALPHHDRSPGAFPAERPRAGRMGAGVRRAGPGLRRFRHDETGRAGEPPRLRARSKPPREGCRPHVPRAAKHGSSPPGPKLPSRRQCLTRFPLRCRRSTLPRSSTTA